MLLNSKQVQIKRFALPLVALLLFFTAKVAAQDDYNTRAKQYIDKYYPLAITEQKNAGIPACITLGQGILETEAGSSELMTQANNHFGIKCKNGWTGETFLHTDDAKDECFKKYKCAEDSYKDHSQHLKINGRYSSLFKLPMTDYASWAKGLKRCGYATDPQYAQRLIKIIEDFNLQQYTYAAMDSSKNIAAMKVSPQQPAATQDPALVDVISDTSKWVIDPKKNDLQIADAATDIDTNKKAPVTQDTVAAKNTDANPLKNIADSAQDFITHSNPAIPVQADFDSTKIVKINGLKAFYAHKGDMLLQYAMKYNVRYSKLLEINDMADGPVPDNSCIYLEKKHGAGANAEHMVTNGETLWTIAQKEGIQLKRLTILNLLSPDDVPAPGAILQLQSPATERPAVLLIPSTAHDDNDIIIASGDKTGAQRDNDYIALRKTAEAPPETDTGFRHATDATERTNNKAVKPSGFPKARPTIPLAEKQPPIVVITTKAPADKNTPVDWVTKDTGAAKKHAAPTEDEQDAKHQELADLKSQLDKVVYADDSKLAATIQSEQAAQKAEDEQAPAKSTKYYTIKRGDTAFSIAKRNKITVKELYKWNDIDASDIKAGKKLKVSK